MQKTLLLALLMLLVFPLYSQLPAGGQWGCPSIPTQSEFDTTCFQRAGEILLGQGYFDHFGGSDPVYLVIPANRPEYAISMAVAWNFYRNVLGHNKMSINQWFATMGQENGFATYNDGVALPNTLWDVEAGANVAIPCDYPRGDVIVILAQVLVIAGMLLKMEMMDLIIILLPDISRFLLMCLPDILVR
jgi:hypothetical protein